MYDHKDSTGLKIIFNKATVKGAPTRDIKSLPITRLLDMCIL